MTPPIDMTNVKKTIGDLLRLAGCDAATDGEIRNAMRFAKRMMDEHHLSESDLVDEPEDQEQAIRNAATGKVETSVGGKHSEWECYLASFVCKFVGGIRYYRSNNCSPDRDARGVARSDKYTKSIVFYGVAEDARIAGEVFDELRMTIMTMARLKFGGCYRGAGRSYCEGFRRGLDDKLYEDRQEQKKLKETSSGTALVLTHRRDALVKLKTDISTAYAKKHLNLVSSGGFSSKRTDGGAYSEGRADGRATAVSANRQRKLS